jgi:hypothetical protein
MGILIIKKKAGRVVAPLVSEALTVPEVKKGPALDLKALDSTCRGATAPAPSNAVSWVLMASYMYYVHSESLISDALFDELIQGLKKNWDQIEHRHKHLIKRDALDTGSLFYLKAGDYPSLVRHAARHLVFQEWGVLINANQGCN